MNIEYKVRINSADIESLNQAEKRRVNLCDIQEDKKSGSLFFGVFLNSIDKVPFSNDKTEGKKNRGSVTKRSRILWALKRSPHVFSKSQESFGMESFQRVFTVTEKINHNFVRGPIIFGSLAHNVPGISISWTSSEK